MKTLFLKTIFTAVILLFSALSQAAWVSVDVVEIRAYKSQVSHFYLTNNFSSPEGCASALFVIRRDDSSNWKMVHSLIMTAVLAGKNIDIRTIGCLNGVTEIDAAALIK